MLRCLSPLESAIQHKQRQQHLQNFFTLTALLHFSLLSLSSSLQRDTHGSSFQVVIVGHLCELNYLDTVRTEGRKRESVELRSSNLLWLSSLYVLRFYIYVSSSSHLSSIVCCFCSHLFTISLDAIHQPFPLSHRLLCHSCKKKILKLEW